MQQVSKAEWMLNLPKYMLSIVYLFGEQEYI